MAEKTQGKRRSGTTQRREAGRTEGSAAQKPERRSRGSQRAGKKAHSPALPVRRENISQEFLLERGELPGSYGETRVALFTLDPHLICAHWQINPTDLRKVRRKAGSRPPQEVPVLRFYDVTHAAVLDTPAAGFFDITVDLSAGNWYIHLWSPGRSYFADLGLVTGGGRFFPITRSNLVHAPPAQPSEEAKEEYLPVFGEPPVGEKLEMPPGGVDTLGFMAPPASRKTSQDISEMALPQRRPQQEGLTAQVTRISPGKIFARDVIVMQIGSAVELQGPSDLHLVRAQRGKPDLSEEAEAVFAPGISSGTAPA